MEKVTDTSVLNMLTTTSHLSWKIDASFDDFCKQGFMDLKEEHE